MIKQNAIGIQFNNKDVNIGLAGGLKINRVINSSRTKEISKSFYQKSMKKTITDHLIKKKESSQFQKLVTNNEKQSSKKLKYNDLEQEIQQLANKGNKDNFLYKHMTKNANYLLKGKPLNN